MNSTHDGGPLIPPVDYAPQRSARSSALYWIVRLRMPVVLGALVIASAILTNGLFIQPDNLINVARQISFEALIAFGMTLIIVTGGIDLSVGSLVALTGVVAALAIQATPADWSPAVRIAIGLCAGIGLGSGVGSLSGAIVTRFSVPPFITTLAFMLIARGMAFIACDGQPVYENLPATLSFLGRGFVFESALGRVLPVPVLIMLLGFVSFHVVLSRTVFGRGVIAVGSNQEAARLSGISVGRTKLLVYLLTGALCGIVGVLQVGKQMAGDPKVGEMLELSIIAAVVVGGTSLFGGRGSIAGTLVGALIIGVLNNSLNLLHVEHFWQKVVLGAIILGAAMLDVALSRLGGHRR
ncbi:MAG: ABC transporter permease [Planctomycetota bacterium]|nr:ABC transporter permease [Planctomycetota bacterium]